MLNPKDYVHKHIVITFTDGQVLRGIVDFYTSKIDDPDGRASLSIKETPESEFLTDVYVDEIKDIEITD